MGETSRERYTGMLWETSSDLGVNIAHVTLVAFVYCSTFWSPWYIKSTLKSSAWDISCCLSSPVHQFTSFQETSITGITCIAISLTSLLSSLPVSSHLSVCTYSPSPVSFFTPAPPQPPVLLCCSVPPPPPPPPPPLASLNLTHHAPNHAAKRALFLHHAVPHHGILSVLNSPVSLSKSVYLPVRCLSVVFGNCMKQIVQVHIGRDYCLSQFIYRHLRSSQVNQLSFATCPISTSGIVCNYSFPVKPNLQ